MAKFCLLWALCTSCVVFNFLHSKSQWLVIVRPPRTSISHPKLPSEEKHTMSCWNRIVCMHKNYLSVLFLFIRKCYAMVFYVLQTVNICISKDIRCTEPTHLDLPNAFPTWRYKGCPSLLLCSFSIWKRQMLSLPLLTF